MPKIIAVGLHRANSYAAFGKDGKLQWHNKQGAHAFDSPEDAREKIQAAMLAAFDKAVASLAKAEAAMAKADLAGGRLGRWPSMGDYAPVWLFKHMDLASGKSRHWHSRERTTTTPGTWTWNAESAAKAFRTEAKAELADIMGSFETFHVRSSSGWLASKSQDASFKWSESFTDAQGFPTREAARAAALTTVVGEAQHAILRTRSVFTESTQERGAPDDVSAAIGAACEARDIESTIVEAANARLGDMAACAPKAKAPRL